jgi:hypothetical protein
VDLVEACINARPEKGMSYRSYSIQRLQVLLELSSFLKSRRLLSYEDFTEVAQEKIPA